MKMSMDFDFQKEQEEIPQEILEANEKIPCRKKAAIGFILVLMGLFFALFSIYSAIFSRQTVSSLVAAWFGLPFAVAGWVPVTIAYCKKRTVFRTVIFYLADFCLIDIILMLIYQTAFA